ncbi:muramidase family protein [Candidatus Marithrix sp. Canyon 246]|uniref:muramidase family protein n=1 Tax=Candidatus Marithrix sp. Canyon 246 TaxID=1827136 RepID=UPI00084A0800|nr:LysM peptidoglycan-binding domain-containing protein [Candidatus Marithrix sp. Canyon 246]
MPLLFILLIVAPIQVYANSTLYDYSYSETKAVKLFSAPKSKQLKVSRNSRKTKTSHIVRRGDSIYKVAKRYGYSYKQLARWNGLKYPYRLKAGRRLRVAPLSKIRVRKKTYKGKSSYVIKRGDSIYKIARRFGYSYKQLARWNALKYPYKLIAGRRLRIAPLPWNRTKKSKVKRKTKSITIQPKSFRNTKGYHKIQRGETLYSISRQYRASVTNIIRWNRLSKPYNLSVGQVLRVYSPSGVRLGSKKRKIRSKITSTRTNRRYHTVSQGETLYSIARHYRKSVQQIAITNKLKKPYHLYKGQRLRINSKKRTSYHYVKSGENLKMIAAKYGLKAYELAKQNGIGNPYTIYPGQRLSIRR